MTREEKFAQLEELCQQRYAIVDNCYRQIATAQAELQILEVKYLKLQAKLYGVKFTKRVTKIEKLKRMLKDLGVEDVDTFLQANVK